MFRNISVVLSGNASSLRAAMVSGARDVERFGSQVERSAAGAASSANMMAAAVATAGVAVAAGLAVAIKSAVQFERAMRNVNSISGLSEHALGALGDQVLALSRELGKSPQDLAKGLYDIASSGFQGANGLKVLRASAIAASAGLSTTATSARAITAVLNAYGRGAVDATDVSDVLFQTVNLGVVSFDELASQIGDVVGMAAAASVGIEQVGSAMATMTLSGISAAESATSLNRLLQSLLQPSDALAMVFERLGYESGSSALKQKGLYNVMMDIQRVTGGNIDVMLALFPEVRAARGAFALLAASGATYTSVAARIEEKNQRAGATMRAFREQMKSVAAQWDVLSARASAAAVVLGTKTLPTVLSVMRGSERLAHILAGPLLTIFQRLNPTFENAGEVLDDLVSIVGALADATGPLAGALASLAVGGLILFLNTLSAAIAASTSFLNDNREVLYAVAMVLAAYFTPAVVRAGYVMMNRFVLTPLVIGLYNLLGALGGATAGLHAFTAAGYAAAAAEAAATLGLAAIIGGLTQLFTASSRAERSASSLGEEMRTAFGDPAKARSLTSLTARLHRFHAATSETTRKLQEQAQSYNTFMGAIVSGLAELNPWADDTQKNAEAKYKALQSTFNDLRGQVIQVADAAALAGGALGITADEAYRLAQKFGIDLTDTSGDAVSALIELYNTNVKTTQSEKNLADSVTSLADVTTTAEDRIKALKQALDALVGIHVNAMEAAIKFEEAIDDITKSVIENGRSLDITKEQGRANTEAILEAVDAITAHVEAMAEEGRSSEQIRETMRRETFALQERMRVLGFTREEILRLTHGLGLMPSRVTTVIEAAGLKEANDATDTLKRNLARLDNQQIQIKVNIDGTATVNGRVVRTPGAVKQIMDRAGVSGMADGGIIPLVEGGMRLPRRALIQTEKPDLIQWAEPGTGGEAFIPMGRSKRGRSTRILAEVAEQFGYTIMPMANGGMFGRSTYVTPSDVYNDILRRLEEAAREAAERQARTHNKNIDKLAGKDGKIRAEDGSVVDASFYHKKAEDFYVQPKVDAKMFRQELAKTAAEQERWRKNLNTIARRAGKNVADALEDMGADGVGLVRQFATASEAELARLTAALKRIAPEARSALEEYGAALDTTAQTQAQFHADLLKLINQGRADLAAALHSLGAEAGGAIAREAVKAKDKDLKAIEADIATINAQAETNATLGRALQLVSVLMANKGIGVRGLSALSGMDLASVLALLEEHKKIFTKLPKAVIRGVQADIRAINSGQQPKAYERGGFFGPSETGIYRFAERGTGGEYLIPVSPQHRQNAVALWMDAGQRLGMQHATRAPGASLVLAPGAVQIPITAAPGMDEARLARLVEDGVRRQFAALRQHLVVRTGRH